MDPVEAPGGPARGPAERWRPGDPVVLREVWRGRVWAAIPAVVVADGPREVRLFVPPRTAVKRAVGEDGRELRLYRERWELADARTAGPVLSFSWPGAHHAVLAMWEPGWTFAGWYVNVETPLGRGGRFYDYVDHCLDALVPPDRSTWAWKDEEELAEAVRRGIYSPEQAERFRAEGERGARRILAGDPPFDRDWSSWRPDPGWPAPGLPEGWDRVEP